MLLTIITPLYNRAHLITACYNSLVNQTCYDFEWIIVDDGSSDHPEQIVNHFSSDLFPICFIQKENGGKHTALNASHDYINGDYVLILDSDDTLTNDAVEQVFAEWEKCESKSQIGIITFLKGASKEEPNCIAPTPGVAVDIMRYKRKIIRPSDCCEVIRSELFLKYPFPVYDGEKFISECALWNRVALTHQCIYINNVIYICEYLNDGLTKSGRALRIKNPLGGMYTANLRMHRKNYLSQRLKNGLLYTCYGFFARLSIKRMLSECTSKGIALLCMPFGKILYYYWSRKYL